MTEIYLIRHCEAEGNVRRIFQGSTDLDISDIGKKQLELLSDRFENIHIDAVYSSPLLRAKKTAHSVADKKGLPVIIVPGLRELYGGVVEGRPFAEIFTENAELGEIWNKHPQDFAPEGGEPMREAYERIWNTVLDLVKENKGKSIAAASHGGVIRCLLCRLIYNDINRLGDMGWCSNTSVSLIKFDDEFTPKLEFHSDSTHLPEELLPKRSSLSSSFKR